MEKLISQLIEVLNLEAKIYDDILKISKNKTNIIVEGKVSELESIVKLEQSLILQMAKFEGQREDLISKISGLINIKPENLTISNLVERVEKDQGESLKSAQTGIVKTIKELTNTNELNSKLIKNSLEYISFSLNLFANAGNEDNNYNLTGEKASAKEKSFFDFKI